MTPDLSRICAELEGLLEKATPGPWCAEPNAWISGPERKGKVADCGPSYGSTDDEDKANAVLILAMRSTLPVLLQAIREQGETERKFGTLMHEEMAKLEKAEAQRDEAWKALEEHATALDQWSKNNLAEMGNRDHDDMPSRWFGRGQAFSDAAGFLRDILAALASTKEVS